MLQIASGKFFSRQPVQRNLLRGVLHTNLQMGNRAPIDTAAGRLLPTSSLSLPSAVVYEITELIEDPPVPGAVASHLVDAYIGDFACVVSFVLDVTCTPDAELARRLTSGHTSHPGAFPHWKLVRRVFDKEVWCRDEDAAHLVRVIADLIGLRRKHYLAAIRAIRTYAKGLRRLADDPELTYTLMVACIESLSERFNTGQPAWEDYPEDKRGKVDDALREAGQRTATRVRKALLEIEHLAVRRRFCDFALDHIAPSFFREEALGLAGPVGRAELSGALQRAYDLRSRHIHALKELPALFTTGFHRGETITINRETMLTLQGITRLTRHVITQFIAREPKTGTEVYNYKSERSGIVTVTLAPQYWVGRVDNLTVKSGRNRFEGFLSQVGARVTGQPDTPLTDLGDVLRWAERQWQNMSLVQRRPFLALYVVYNRLFLSNAPMEALTTVTQTHQRELRDQSAETMMSHLLLGTVPEWPIEEHQAVHDAYLRAQGKRSCLRVPKNLTAGLSLALADRYRVAGDPDRAKTLITTAVENYPDHPPLCQLERSFDPDQPIHPLQILRIDTTDMGTNPT